MPDALHGWRKQCRIAAGLTAGTTTTGAKRIKDPEREARELKRENEILVAACSCFARELTRDCPGVAFIDVTWTGSGSSRSTESPASRR